MGVVGGLRSINGFPGLGGLPRRFTKLDPGMETRFSRALGTLDYCSRTETTQNKVMRGFPSCIGHNTYVCSRKSWSEET